MPTTTVTHPDGTTIVVTSAASAAPAAATPAFARSVVSGSMREARADLEVMTLAVLDLVLERARAGYDYVDSKISTITGERAPHSAHASGARRAPAPGRATVTCRKPSRAHVWPAALRFGRNTDGRGPSPHRPRLR